VLAAAGLLFVAREASRGPSLSPGATAPDFRLPDLAGSEHALAALRGRLVLVNFWASWCAPCVAEMPSLERLHRRLGPEGLELLGVSVDEDEGALRRFVREHGLTFPILRDPGGRRAAASYGVGGYPETVIVGPDGVVLESYRGPAQWDTPGALAHFRGRLTSLSTSPTR